MRLPMLPVRFRLVSLLLACVASGCASAEPGEGLAEAGELAQQIERVRDQARVSQEKVDAAVRSLQQLAAFGFEDDAAAAYGGFVASVDASATQLVELRESVEGLKSSAGSLFQSWQENLAAIESEAMRQRSAQRQSEMRARFEAVVAAASAAHAASETFHRSLR